ncbi:DUF3253 domain-containing protein, partial [Thermaurantiacus sp.]
MRPSLPLPSSSGGGGEPRGGDLGALAARRPGASICPTEAARLLAGPAWRDALPAVDAAGRRLARGCRRPAAAGGEGRGAARGLS